MLQCKVRNGTEKRRAYFKHLKKISLMLFNFGDRFKKKLIIESVLKIIIFKLFKLKTKLENKKN